MDVDEASADCSAVVATLSETIVADRTFFETLLVGLLARGHILIEDAPGTGKTLTARSFATALGLSFSRIQFTPDLLPTDVTGTHVFDERERTFELRRGPIFANVVLGDEINRAPPKTQAALLEAMEEGQVTIGGETYALPEPFFVVATQNPIESEGTFPLPEAQIDRFVVKTSLGYPDLDGEVELLRRRAARDGPNPTVERVLDGASAVTALQRRVETVHVSEDVLKYVARISHETRSNSQVSVGVSPRGTQRLFEAARAHAVVAGREFVVPQDIKTVAEAVLAHRLVLTPEASVGETTNAGVVESVLESVPVPTVE
jgi:MoxR-like ATPase